MASAVIAELEAALLAHGNDDATLAVYADALQSAGDPRGELIALELHAARHGATPALDADRYSKLLAWLGGERCGRRKWRLRDVRGGRIVNFTGGSDGIAALVASPAWPYIERVRIADSEPYLSNAVLTLASRPLPWLRRLEIDRDDAGPSEPLADNVIAALVAAAPRLDEVVVAGRRVLAPPGIPGLRRLGVRGRQALSFDHRGDMPDVRELDLALGATGGDPAVAAPVASAARFPALTHLDLSRNEYAYEGNHRHNVSVFPFVFAIDATRLDALRLPSLRNAEDVRRLDVVLHRATTTTVEVARAYRRCPVPPPHPRLRLPREPLPWPPRSQVSVSDGLMVARPGSHIAILDLMTRLEADYEDLDTPTLAAWHALWKFLDTLRADINDRWSVEQPFDASTLVRAFDILEDNVPNNAGRIADELRDLPAGATVPIKRHWT